MISISDNFFFVSILQHMDDQVVVDIVSIIIHIFFVVYSNMLSTPLKNCNIAKFIMKWLLLMVLELMF